MIALIVIACILSLSIATVAWYRHGPAAQLSPSVLSAREQAVIAAAGDAFFPARGPIPLSGSEAGVVAYFDAYLRRAPKRQQLLMRLLFLFTELSPLVFGPRRRRFTRLTIEERIAFLRTAFESSIYFRRLTFTSLRALMTMAYLANGEVARSMGMRPNRAPFEGRHLAAGAA